MSGVAPSVPLRGPNDFYARSGSLKWAVCYPLREDSACECAYCSISHGLLSLRRVSIGSCVSAFFNVVVPGLRWWWCFFFARGMGMFGS